MTRGERADAKRRSPGHAGRGQLASLLQDQGQLEEAAPLFRRDLEASERTLGADHPDTLASVGNLPLQDQGQLEEAAPLFRRALEAHERTLGADHPDTLASVANLASLQAQGQPRRRRHCTGVTWRRADAGRRAPGHAGLGGQPGVAAAGPGPAGGGGATVPACLEASERTLGADHDTLASVANLASPLQAQGQLEEAAPLFRRDLEASERTLGADTRTR